MCGATGRIACDLLRVRPSTAPPGKSAPKQDKSPINGNLSRRGGPSVAYRYALGSVTSSWQGSKLVAKAGKSPINGNLSAGLARCPNARAPAVRETALESAGAGNEALTPSCGAYAFEPAESLGTPAAGRPAERPIAGNLSQQAVAAVALEPGRSRPHPIHPAA